jgi:hypothetical protein
MSHIKKIYKRVKNFFAPPKSKSLTMQHMNVNEEENVETTIYSPSATNDGEGFSDGGVCVVFTDFVGCSIVDYTARDE